MKTIKRILKKWLGINELIALYDERDIYVNKRITEERERYNKLFITNERNLANAVKTYDKMIDDINDKIDNIDDDYANSRINTISSRVSKLETIVNNDIGNNKDEQEMTNKQICNV